jgi:hypothetical protein
VALSSISGTTYRITTNSSDSTTFWIGSKDQVIEIRMQQWSAEQPVPLAARQHRSGIEAAESEQTSRAWPKQWADAINGEYLLDTKRRSECS